MTETPNPAQGKRNLANAVATNVAQGYRVESQTDETAVLVKGQQTNHVLHLILSLLTCGFWAIVWIAMVVINKERRIILRLDDYGNVLHQVA